MKNFLFLIIFFIFQFLLNQVILAQPVPTSPTSTSANLQNNSAVKTEGAKGDPSFLDKYPHLKENLYREPESGFNLGMSVGLLGVADSAMYFNLNFFQVHYTSERWDNELFTVTYGMTSTSASYLTSNRFTFRTIPKYRWNDFVSFGPLIGYEYVSFPNIISVQYKSGLETKPEPFSSAGMIYGLAASENFKLDSGTLIKLTEVAYQETYSTLAAGSGWTYLYQSQSSLNVSQSPIQASLVFSIELGFYF